ncbi:MAG: GTPase Era [Myxococcales bacterium]|nr:GTPase Era [Myxococcales bacterium]
MTEQPSRPVQGPPDSEAAEARAHGTPQQGAPGGVAGVVAIVGEPNVGKSTLLNRVVGEKLAIVTPKPQTTRNRILGVWNGPQGQIVFVDTPGVHAARSALGKYMVDEAYRALEQVDAVLMVVDLSKSGAGGSRHLPRGARKGSPVEAALLERVKQAGKPAVLALNKVDQFKDKSKLFPVLEGWNETGAFSALVPISATKDKHLDGLVSELLKLLPEGPPLYDPDTLTDRTERFLVGELVREQVFLQLYQELPFSTGVEIDSWQERPDKGDVVISATIVVERESQKAIVVGRAGAVIRDIGKAARQEATQLLGRPAHLKLFVKVSRDWTESREGLGQLGYAPESDR